MLQKLCAFILYRLMHWKLNGTIPRQLSHLLLVLLPHTSNWDFVIGWLFIRAEGLTITMFGKDDFYFFPLNYGYRLFNVVPIKRGQKADFVGQATQLYLDNDYLWTAMAPEGTRSHVTKLKSGYYHLAKTADLPILVVGPNFKARTMNIMPPRKAMQTFEQDAENLVCFARSMHARHPDLAL